MTSRDHCALVVSTIAGERRADGGAPGEAHFAIRQRDVPQQVEQGARNDVREGIHN